MRFGYLLMMLLAVHVTAEDNETLIENATNATKTEVRKVGQSKNAEDKRLPEKWGHVEMIGSGKEYEFIKALFGGQLHCKSEPLVLANPIDACNTIQQKSAKGHILFAWRGGCTFSDKAWFAQTAGAAGLIIGNTDQSIVRMPEGYHAVTEEEAVKPEITIPVVMVRQSSGEAIEKIANRFTVVPSVAIVAKHWSTQGTFISGPCKAVYRQAAIASQIDTNSSGGVAVDGAPVVVENASEATSRMVRSFSLSDVEMLSTDSGRMYLVGDPTGRSFEYIRGNFGGPPPVQPLPLVVADPIEGCNKPKNADALIGAVAVVRRGKCSFTTKMQAMEAAGAMAMVLINSAGKALVQMSDGGLSENLLTVYPLMVLHTAQEALVAAADRRMHVRFARGDFSLQPLWDRLAGIAAEDVSRWPKTQEQREELFLKLRAPHDPEVSNTGSAERLAFIEEIYRQLPAIQDTLASISHSEL